MASLRQGKIISDSSGNRTVPSSSYVALDLLYHISSFSKVLAAADVLDIIGSPAEKAAFAELKNVILIMMNSGQCDLINIQPFLDKLSAWTNVDYCKVDPNDILCVWDDIVKLIMVVIPPLREVFLGQVSSALEVPGWLNLMSRCFHAHFTDSAMTLEEVYLNSLTSSPILSAKESNENDNELALTTATPTNTAATAGDKLRIANAMVLRRAPEILVISIESAHLSSSFLVQTTGSSSKPPTGIRYPETFDLALFYPGNNNNNNNNGANGNSNHETSKIYDLSTVVALEGNALDSLQTYFRIAGEEQKERWYRGAGLVCEEVSKGRVVEGNFYGGNADRRVHPRLLIYTRRDLPQVLDRTLHLVSKAGQMRALGDVAFAVAMTTENYGEARRCYEEAIALDEGLRLALQENLSSLEKIERTQRARVLEEQADLALANKRFREASELYSKGMMNAVVSSGVYLRVRDKLESVTHIIALDQACQYAEKGEEALKLGLFPNAKDFYSQAFKLNPEILHLHTILVGIDKTVQMQTAGQKIADAQTAAKGYHYKLANHYYREAIALVPEKLAGLQSTLDSLAPLMQGEDALMRQKAGLAALEDKRYAAAIQLFTEAIGLLPETQASCLEHAVFLCDRALAHYDLKDFHTAVQDCSAALRLKPELAIAHFRLGASQFGLDMFDLASVSYDKALKCDHSLSELIKVKVRQVTTAREIQMRKERETERAIAREEEKKVLDEKRAKDEQNKRERAEKLAIEQAEKAERNRIKEEERRAKAAKQKEEEKEKEIEKEAEKERLRVEKIERDAQKAAERERTRVEKEKERERLRVEKEQKAIDSRRALDEERHRQQEFTAELERAAARQKELEREKEAEREKARLEREKLISEREKARKEKIEVEAVKAAEDLAKAATLVPAPVAVISVPVPLPVATVPPPAVVVVTSSSTSSSSSAPTSSSSSVSETVHSVEVVKSPLSLPVSPVAKGAVHVQSQVHGQQGNVQVPEAVVGDGGGGVGSMGKPPVPLAINTNNTTPTITSSGSRWSTVAVLPSRTSPVSIVDDKDEIRSSSSSIISPTNAMLKVPSSSNKWTASKSSADTITRVPSSSSKLKGIPPSTDNLAEFPKLGNNLGGNNSGLNSGSISGINTGNNTGNNSGNNTVLNNSILLNQKVSASEGDVTVNGSTASSLSNERVNESDDDGQELGWSVHRSSPIKDRDSASSSSSSLLGGSGSGSSDIFSSMAERPAMSTDYTFKPSERTIKAAEAKRLADSQQKAAAAAAANSLSGNAKGDFDEFLSSSSASYISNFSSSIRFNRALSSDNPPNSSNNNGLFFSSGGGGNPPTGRPPTTSSSGNYEHSNMGQSFSSSFSGLGFSTSFLSSSGSPTSPSSASTGVRNSGMGIGMGGIGLDMNMNGSTRHSENNDDMDDDFNAGYFNNPLTLGGLDLDDTDPLLMAIGGLSMDSPTIRLNAATHTPSSTTPPSPIRQLGVGGLLSQSASPLRPLLSQGGQGQGQVYNSFSATHSPSVNMNNINNNNNKNSGISNSGNRFPKGTGQFGFLDNSGSPSSFSPSLDPLPMPMPFQRAFSADNQGGSQGQGLNGINGISFPIMGSSSLNTTNNNTNNNSNNNNNNNNNGISNINSSSNNINKNLNNLNNNNSNINSFDSFLIGEPALQGDYFNQQGGIGGRGGVISPHQSFNTQQQQQQQLFSQFHSMPPSSAGNLLGGDRSPLRVDNQQQLHNLYTGGPLPSTNPNPLYPSIAPNNNTTNNNNNNNGLLPNQGQQQQPVPGAEGGEGIEADILPESAFSSVAWLRQHGMHMYRWAGDVSEWTEYAMHLPAVISHLFSTEYGGISTVLAELQAGSGCKMWVDKETLLGWEATFLVFLRGAAGQPSNASMNTALDLLSNKMRLLLPQLNSQSLSLGSIGSNRGSTPPPPSFNNASSDIHYNQQQQAQIPQQQQQHQSAWGETGSSSFLSSRLNNNSATESDGLHGHSQSQSHIYEEENSTGSDEYYDPEDLARSMSLLGEGEDGEWSTVSSKRSASLPSTRRPEPLRLGAAGEGGYVQRWLEIPRDSVGLVIGQGGKKIKDLCGMSGAKIQFRVNKTAERGGRPGLLELQGAADNVDAGLQLVWDLLHLLGKEYQEVPVQRLK